MSAVSESRPTNRVLRLLGNPEMLKAYAVWTTTCTFRGRPPVRRYGEEYSAGEWLNFSEYWQWRHGIVADRRVVRICREHCKAGDVAVDVGANIGLFSAMLVPNGIYSCAGF
jgi:hypothetical protein